MRINCARLGLVFLLLSLIPLVMGILLYFNTSHSTKDAIKTQATIVDIVATNKSTEKGHLYAPVVEFSEQTGRTIREAAVTSSGHNEFKIGQVIEVYYNADNPQSFRVDSISRLGFGTIACTLFMIASLVSSALCYSFYFLGKYVYVKQSSSHHPTDDLLRRKYRSRTLYTKE